MIAYLAGVVTLPVLYGLYWLSLFAGVLLERALDARGLEVRARVERHSRDVSDFLLSHDIWWERSFGPVFAGGWYHEWPQYQAPDEARFNRWLGIGPTSGPCVYIVKKRVLGPVS